MRYCKLVLSLLIFLLVMFLCSASSIESFVIKPEKRIAYYNNKGLLYLDDGFYFAAITSFKIALGLNPNTAASAPIYDNLGKAYLKTNAPQMAQECFEAAIMFSPMTFSYYQNLVHAYKEQNILETKLQTQDYKVEECYKQIVTALILLELGDENHGKELLTNFVEKEPSMLLSSAIIYFLENSK